MWNNPAVTAVIGAGQPEDSDGRCADAVDTGCPIAELSRGRRRPNT